MKQIKNSQDGDFFMQKNTYGFIGLGLIGGSLAGNLRKQDRDCRIMAYTRTRSTLENAKKEGLIDEICSGPDDPLFSGCSCIFLCAPVENNSAALRELKKILSPECLLTDVGSVKGTIHREVERLSLEAQFVGGHPMTGSEQSGLANAQNHLFENAYYILTPTRLVPREWTQRLFEFARSLKAIPMIMDWTEHDRITAAISHLPHLIASALVNTVHDLDNEDQHMKMIAAGGFRDITRIASSSPEMWEQICVDNCGNISRVMDVFMEKLKTARDHMCGGDGGYINRMFAASSEYRDSFSFASSGPVKKMHIIYCDVIDENGAIATIATILAVHGISIKNIRIVHNREHEQGALAIEFYKEEAMDSAVRILRHHRYVVSKND